MQIADVKWLTTCSCSNTRLCVAVNTAAAAAPFDAEIFTASPSRIATKAVRNRRTSGRCIEGIGACPELGSLFSPFD
jgi:hypothetical protein